MLVRIMLCGLAGCILLSWQMWGIGERTFPLLPLVGDAREPTGSLQAILFGAMVVLLGICLVIPSRSSLLLLMLILLVMCTLDLNRLQPWLWFFLLTLGIAFFGKNSVSSPLRWLLAAVYVWSGANKLTPYFAEDNFPWFCQAFESTRFLGEYSLLGYMVAILEIGMGLLLLWPGVSKKLRWIFVIFHGSIIIILLKAQWNFVVLPWNAAIAAMAFIVLSRPFEWKFPLQTGQKILAGTAWLTPVLGLFHLWPYQLCWQMYSNTQPEASFYSQQPCEKTGRVWAEKSYDQGKRLLLDDWALVSLHVPMFYSDHTFRQMGRYLCACVPEGEGSGLVILHVHPWNKNAERTEEITCTELLDK